MWKFNLDKLLSIITLIIFIIYFTNNIYINVYWNQLSYTMTNINQNNELKIIDNKNNKLKKTNTIKSKDIKIPTSKKIKYDYGDFYNKFLKDMYLDWCRIYQKEEEHMNHWHMYATDIPCIRWKSHEIKAPKIKNVYLLIKNWKDKYLWDYIVLKHWEYRYVFAHTKSNLKEWIKVYPWDVLWKTNLSGVSQNYHLHFEVWKDWYNVKLENENIKNTKYTAKLIKQRNWGSNIVQQTAIILNNDSIKNKNIVKKNIPNKISKQKKLKTLSNKEIVLIKKAIQINKTKNEELFKKTLDKIPKIDNESINNNLCENIYMSNTKDQKELLKKYNCNIDKISNNILKIKKGNYNDYTDIVNYNNRKYSVNLWKERTQKIIEKYWKDQEKVLDLLTIMTLECNKKDWLCFNWNDIWPFQINKIHKEWYNKSYQLYLNKKSNELFDYQLEKASELLDSYNKNLCKPEYIKKYWVWDTYNKKRWRCIAFNYNGHPKYKFAYNKLGWKKRMIIKKYLIQDWILK